MRAKQINEILSKPYERVLIPDSESGKYTALIKEFPGCIAEGESPSDAIENLNNTAQAWLLSCIERGVDIPEPNYISEFSGKVALRMSRLLHKRATEAARQETTSLNQFIISAISEKLGTVSTIHYIENRLADTFEKMYSLTPYTRSEPEWVLGSAFPSAPVLSSENPVLTISNKFRSNRYSLIQNTAYIDTHNLPWETSVQSSTVAKTLHITFDDSPSRNVL